MRGRAVRRGGLHVALLFTCLGAASALASVPAAAASGSTVGYGPGDAAHCGTATYCWGPSTVTINPGDTVSFSAMPTGYHELNEVSGLWPAGCPQASVGSCSFAYSGTYNFNCNFHRDQMKGSVVVTGNIHPPAPSPTPTHTTPPAPTPTHSQPAPQPPAVTPRPTPPPPSPSPTAEVVALAPSPSPSLAESPAPSVAPSVAPAAASSTSSSRSPVPAVVAIVVLLAAAGGAFYWYRRRLPA